MKDRMSIYLAIALVLVLCGCSTCYVAHLRGEYNSYGHCYGVYDGEDEYPSIFPATKVSAAIEIPAWWWPGKTKVARAYQRMFWPLGAAMSIMDLPISIVSDTIMFPYDVWQVLRRE